MRDSVKEAKQYWNSTHIVNEFSNAKPPEYWKEFFSSIEEKEQVKILDLGCGGGRNTLMIAEMGFQTYACDLHIGMVEVTRNKVKQLLGDCDIDEKVRQENMQMLSYEDGQFDIVLANGIYHNTSTLQEFEQAISETARILKSNGILCMNVFTDEIVDEGLTKQEKEYLYLTPDNLDMILLPKNKIIEILEKFHLKAVEEPVSYPSKINVGVRSVVRGRFQKK